MLKLTYKSLLIEGIVFYVAKSRCRTMHITIKSDGKPYAVCPKYVSDEEFATFLKSKLKWVKKSITKVTDISENAMPRMTIRELKMKVAEYISIYKPLMGVDINRVTFRNMQTLWGSCTKNRKTIRFSTMLTKCSDRFIEYVVVHEMAHLIEANHSKRFWAIVAEYIPDYKLRKRKTY